MNQNRPDYLELDYDKGNALLQTVCVCVHACPFALPPLLHGELLF